MKIELAGSAMDLAAIPFTPQVKATASNIAHSHLNDFGPQAAFDQDPATRWATDDATKQAWIACDMERTVTVSRVRIAEALAERVQNFELQYRAGEGWKTIFGGGKIGRAFTRTFPAVTAREFRLNILDATHGPTIAEIELSAK